MKSGNQAEWHSVSKSNNIDWDSEFSENIYFEKAREWKNNVSNYVDFQNDFEAYKKQPLEVSAENFAEEEADRLFAFHTTKSSK